MVAVMDSPPADQDVQAVIELELRLQKPDVRAEPGAVEALLHPGFSEFGASGRRWGKTEMIAALAAEQPAAEEPVGEETAAEEPVITATEMCLRHH
jgi:Domain of unknown function (DUF4440)